MGRCCERTARSWASVAHMVVCFLNKAVELTTVVSEAANRAQLDTNSFDLANPLCGLRRLDKSGHREVALPVSDGVDDL